MVSQYYLIPYIVISLCDIILVMTDIYGSGIGVWWLTCDKILMTVVMIFSDDNIAIVFNDLMIFYMFWRYFLLLLTPLDLVNTLYIDIIYIVGIIVFDIV